MSASRFYDGQQAATHSVRIFLFGRELRIVGEDDLTLAVWRASDMRSGAGNRSRWRGDADGTRPTRQPADR